MLSLLNDGDFSDPRKPVEHLDDFMLGGILTAVTPDLRLQRTAREVLTHPLTDALQVEYRREIVKDFADRGLPIDKLLELFGSFGDIQDAYRDQKSRLFRLFGGVTDHSQILLCAAGTVKMLIELIYSINGIFRLCEPNSLGLKRIMSRIDELAGSPDMRDLYDCAVKFQNFSASENLTETEFCISESGKINGFGMISTQKLPKEQNRVFGKRRFYDGVRAELSSEEAGKIISDVAREVCEAFEFVISSLCGEFSQIYYELNFYAFAVKYCDAIKKTSMPTVYADLTDDTYISKLYDLYLLLMLPNPEAVVPNDFTLESGKKGMIITGKNSSGKTVYLRAATMAYIFTAAGLPIAAKSAKIALPRDIYLQMASAERAYRSGDITGRFEAEVIDMKSIVDRAAEGDIIVLNEVFQTTDYSEGSDGLYHILEYLSRKGATWLLVTHLKRLEELLGKDKKAAKLCAGDEKYSFKSVNIT